MDGIHDLGGKQGYGPVAVDHSGHVQLDHWEARMWAIAQTCKASDWTGDWWRHITERIDPAVYLNIPYFEKWMLTYSTGFITSDLCSTDEVIAGHPKTLVPPPSAQSVADVLEAVRTGGRAAGWTAPSGPIFDIGQNVHTKVDIDADHTRLPAYARGRTGQIIAHHGPVPLPDLNAKGITQPEHLYTVVFTARTLWGAAGSDIDTVRLDLWESYLDVS